MRCPNAARPVCAAVAAFALLAAAPAVASPVVGERPASYATDLTGRVPVARLSALNETLAQFERETSTQVLVYLDARLPAGTTIEEFAARAFEAWGIGQKGKDNGALFVAFLDDRVMRLEVGYGLEGALPDARAIRILDDEVRPRFRAGDLAGGVESAAGGVMAAVRGEPYQGSGYTVAETPGVVVLSFSGPPGVPLPVWPFVLAGLVAVGLTVMAARGLKKGRQPQPWLMGLALGLSVAAVVLVVGGAAAVDGRPMACGALMFVAGMVALALGRAAEAWKATAAAKGGARWTRRLRVAAWLSVLALAGVAVVQRTAVAGWAFLAAVELALAASAAVAAFENTGGRRVKAVASPLAFMLAAGLVPVLYAALTVGITWPLPAFVLFGGAFMAGLLTSSSGIGAGGGSGSWSYGGGSRGSSWGSSSSSSSSSRSSSSSFSGGGGRSGGGGASSSW